MTEEFLGPLLVIGAHPDDCELKAGGLTALYRAAGHHVKYVSVTNGEAGHHWRTPSDLAAVRRAESDAVAKLMGIEYEILGNRDGRLLPTLEARFELIGLIRRFQPDLILLDLGLPKLNGYEACRRIRQQSVGVKPVIVAQTGWGQEEDRQRTREAGFDHHFVKPIDPDAHMNLLATLIPANPK